MNTAKVKVTEYSVINEETWRNMSNEQLGPAARQWPKKALQHAPDRLDRDTLEYCVSERSYEALKFAYDCLDRELLGKAVASRPAWSSLDLAAHKLPRDLLDETFRRDPAFSMRRFPDLIDDQMFNDFAVLAPDLALENGADRLTEARLDACAAARPDLALKHAGHRLDPLRLDHCASLHPREALRECPSALSQDRLMWCVQKSRSLPAGVMQFLSEENFDTLVDHMPERTYQEARRQMDERQLARCENLRTGTPRALPRPVDGPSVCMAKPIFDATPQDWISGPDI